MRPTHRNAARELVVDVQRRLPAGQRFIQEAFTVDHRRPVVVRITDLRPDTFYYFDEVSVRAFRDAVVESAVRDTNGRLTIGYPLLGEFQAQQHRLQLLASKLEKIRVLGVGSPRGGERIPRLDYYDVMDSSLASFTIAVREGARPLLFICRDLQRHKGSSNLRGLGFFSFDADTVEEIADDIELVRRGLAARLTTFDKLELLHQTTQQVARELESYSRRMELAVRRARRRPDLLTPARFERIVGQAIAKMEQLQDIPRRALRAIEKTRR